MTDLNTAGRARQRARTCALRGILLVPAMAAGSAAFAQAAHPAPAQVVAGAQAGKVVALLLQQARYWRDQTQYDKAQSAIDRALQVAPEDPDVLQAQGDLQAARGNLDGARRSRMVLARVAPGSAQLGALDQALKVQAIDPAELSSIRAVSSSGNNQAAVAGYRQMFGNQPPPQLALEYYQTLAGTPSGWTEARNGLAQIVASSPNDLQAQLAFAKALTYRESTRGQGIARLRELAGLSARSPVVAEAAAQGWRQSLLWLPNAKSSIPLLQAWLQQHPDDTVIADRIKNASVQVPIDPVAADRASGFASLSADHLDEAEARFSAALARTPNDSDALGGLGLVRSRQNRIVEAGQLLRQAIAADPSHASRWQPALDGLSVGEDYATARSLIAHGRYDEAENRLDTLVRRPGDPTGARLMLADLQRRRGHTADAAQTFQTILDSHPENADALLGLARLRMQAGQSAAAQTLLDRLGGRRGAEVAQIEAQTAVQQADQTATLDDKIAVLRNAVDRGRADDPWLRLRLAQALLANGQRDQAQATMAQIGQSAHPSVAALQAGILFAGQTDDLATAGQLLQRLPARNRTADVKAVADRVALDREIADAQADGDMGRTRLVALARHPDPTGARGARIAQVLAQAGDRVAARRAIRVAEQVTPLPTASQHLAYAGALVGIGDSQGAHAELDALDRQRAAGGVVLTPDQEAARARLAAGLAVVESDKLNEQGRPAEAYDRLAPVLAADPTAVAPQLALARLYQSDSRPRKALALDLAVLERDPSDLDARLAAVQAAVDCGDVAQAATIARDALTVGPQDPRAWLAAAAVHQARGNAAAALGDLRRARDLRRQQLGTDRNTMINRVAAVDTPVADDNPFRRNSTAGLASTNDEPDRDGLPGVDEAPDMAQSARAAPDPMLASIDTQIDTLGMQTAPRLEVNVGLRSRSGSGGLDSLTQVTTPITATLPVGVGSAHWYATLTPTVLSSGSLDQGTTTVDRFGTLALSGSAADASGQSSQAGVAIQFGYANRWLNADAGSSPLGFRTTNVVGGAELSPKLSPNLTLRMTGERRAVTDSMLSYGGLRDPGTGTVWGGVTRTRGHAQVELANKDAVIYVGGGYAQVDGTHVADNSEVEAGVGGSVQVWHNDTQRVRVGVDLTYFGYDKNLRYFTLGQGGYFSPQSYVAAVLPVTWTGVVDRWKWTLAGSLGYQNYTEHSSSYYPDDPALQASLEGSGATTTAYAARSVSGLAGGANGKIEYQLMPSLLLGATASYQRTGDWDEAQALLTAHYAFSGTP